MLLILVLQKIHPNPCETSQVPRVTVTSRRSHNNYDRDFSRALFSVFLVITEVGMVGVGWKVDGGSAYWIGTVEPSWRL